MELSGKEAVVIGAGLSGIYAAALLSGAGVRVTLNDGNREKSEAEVEKSLPEGTRADVIIGDLPDEGLERFAAAVVSPGVPTDAPPVIKLKEKNIPVWGEIELAYRFGRGRIAAITGTNGKTTTTTLVGEILKTHYPEVFVAGNIGNAYTQAAPKTTDRSVLALELSSFQLETIDTFHPDVSAILNITPDHLNRHHTMEAYIDAKLAITKNQKKDDVCILNYEDPILRERAAALPCRVFYFSSARRLETGIFLDREGVISYRENGREEALCRISQLKLLGTHNYENVMAAAAIGIQMGVPIGKVRRAVTAFEAVEHRIEYVAEKKGVKYYNDSKGTNPDAAIRGIQAMVTPTLLIGGGYDKGSGYEEWIGAFDGKVKHLVLIGQTREKIKETALRLGFLNVTLADSLEEAVAVCESLAAPGDSVLLSPACASWGMFRNYEERGRRFKELVGAIKDE